MMVDIQQITTSIVAILTPFLAQFAGASVEQIGKMAGGGIAQKLWERLKPKIEAEPKLQTAVLTVSQLGESETAQKLLIETMLPFLSVDPSLLKDLTTLLALDNPQQSITVEDSEVRDITQTTNSQSRINQEIMVKNSKARDITQKS